MTTRTITYTDALGCVCDLTEGLSSGNSEYERGQLELLADMFGVSNMETYIRVDQIAHDVRAMWNQQLERGT